MYNIQLMKHCGMVAQAAFMIAQKTKGILDQDIAHRCGLFHDFGKYFVSESDKYKHPRLGYIMMMQNKEEHLAKICLTHPFPVLSLDKYVEAYCRGDQEEASEIIPLLRSVKTDLYVELIQYCDKIAGLDKYVSLKEKFEWYQKKSPTIDPALIHENYKALLGIQSKFEDLTHQSLHLTNPLENF